MVRVDINVIKESIKNEFVEPPTQLSNNEFKLWCDGYAKCYKEIMDLLERLKEEYDQPS